MGSASATTLSDLGKLSGKGVPVGGTLFDLQEELAKINDRLAPDDAGKLAQALAIIRTINPQRWTDEANDVYRRMYEMVLNDPQTFMQSLGGACVELAEKAPEAAEVLATAGDCYRDHHEAVECASSSKPPSTEEALGWIDGHTDHLDLLVNGHLFGGFTGDGQPYCQTEILEALAVRLSAISLSAEQAEWELETMPSIADMGKDVSVWWNKRTAKEILTALIRLDPHGAIVPNRLEALRNDSTSPWLMKKGLELFGEDAQENRIRLLSIQPLSQPTVYLAVLDKSNTPERMREPVREFGQQLQTLNTVPFMAERCFVETLFCLRDYLGAGAAA